MALSPPNQRNNPLMSLMRQPKIYIRLPSNGRYYTEGSLEFTENNEYAVYSMTAKDEILLKTPDALMNGQSIVDVIQSCVPNIKDAWQVPSIDLDTIMVAIRLATYGEMMDMEFKVGEDTLSFQVDLRTVLDELYQTITWDERISVGENMAIFIRPASYAIISKTSIQNFETQKIINLVADSSLSEEQKIENFRESFRKLTDITVGIIHSSVYKIESVVGTVEDSQYIIEFLDNSEKTVFDAIKQRLDELKNRNTLKPIRVKATPEMIANGSDPVVEVPLILDPATFFA